MREAELATVIPPKGHTLRTSSVRNISTVRTVNKFSKTYQYKYQYSKNEFSKK